MEIPIFLKLTEGEKKQETGPGLILLKKMGRIYTNFSVTTPEFRTFL